MVGKPTNRYFVGPSALYGGRSSNPERFVLSSSSALPSRRIEGLTLQELGDEILVYDLDRDVAHCLGPVAARVWSACGDGVSESDFLNSNPNIDEQTMHFALAELRGQMLLKGEPLIVHNAMSRRQLVTNAAAVAVGATLVTLIVAPTPAHAGSAPGITCPAGGSCSATTLACNSSSGMLDATPGGTCSAHSGADYCCPATAMSCSTVGKHCIF